MQENELNFEVWAPPDRGTLEEDEQEDCWEQDGEIEGGFLGVSSLVVGVVDWFLSRAGVLTSSLSTLEQTFGSTMGRIISTMVLSFESTFLDVLLSAFINSGPVFSFLVIAVKIEFTAGDVTGSDFGSSGLTVDLATFTLADIVVVSGVEGGSILEDD